MYINRIILRDVRNFKHLDITLRNDWTEKPLKSVLLTGPNGSGKRTVMEAIFKLWANFRSRQSPHYSPGSSPYNEEIGLSAIELRNFNDEIQSSLWLYATSNGDLEKDFLTIPQLSDWIAGDAKPNEPYLQRMPNITYVTDKMRLPKIVDDRVEIQSNPQTTQWQEFLEGLISYHKELNPDEVARMIEAANKFLWDKELFLDTNPLKLMVRIGDIQHHYAELSSGEKLALLLLFTVTLWLRPGGIILISEPAMNLHVSLQRQLIYRIREIVEEKNGQLIVTSHSPTMWEEFNERQRINLAEEDQHDQKDGREDG